jgi:cyclin-dependent kinase
LRGTAQLFPSRPREHIDVRLCQGREGGRERRAPTHREKAERRAKAPAKQSSRSDARRQPLFLNLDLLEKNKKKRQMEEEGVPSTALREVSLLQMLSESNHVVK